MDAKRHWKTRIPLKEALENKNTIEGTANEQLGEGLKNKSKKNSQHSQRRSKRNLVKVSLTIFQRLRIKMFQIVGKIISEKK